VEMKLVMGKENDKIALRMLKETLCEKREK